jgi:hypothetical protein
MADGRVNPSFFHPPFLVFCPGATDIRIDAKTTTTMRKTVSYGLATGILSGIWSIVTFQLIGWLNRTAFHNSLPAADIRSIGGIFSVVILIIGIWLGMREVRRRNHDILSFGLAIKTGVLIAVITAIILGGFSWLYCTVINPGYTDYMVLDARQTMQTAGKSPAEIAARLDSVRQQFSAGSQVVQALVGQAAIGTIISLIFAAFLKTKQQKG